MGRGATSTHDLPALSRGRADASNSRQARAELRVAAREYRKAVANQAAKPENACDQWKRFRPSTEHGAPG
jgi:hypothetical protein